MSFPWSDCAPAGPIEGCGPDAKPTNPTRSRCASNTLIMVRALLVEMLARLEHSAHWAAPEEGPGVSYLLLPLDREVARQGLSLDISLCEGRAQVRLAS
jgi:hypothetical protein